MKNRERSEIVGRAWRDAQQLRALLLAGHDQGFTVFDAPHVPTEPDEPVFACTVAALAHWKPGPPDAQGDFFVFGHPLFVAAAMASEQRARARRARESRPAWRDHAVAQVVITDRRLLIQPKRAGWTSLPYADLADLVARPERGELQMSFVGYAPFRLAGLWIPWAAVAITALVYGTHYLTSSVFDPLN